MIISVDFDGTCVTHEFPKVGKDIGAEVVLKALANKGYDILCLSMRSNEHKESIGVDTIQGIRDWFKSHGIPLYAINNNPEQELWSKSRKVYANLYIDDQFLGCPLNHVSSYSNRPFVDWVGITNLLFRYDVITGPEYEELTIELEKEYPELYN